MTPDEFARKWLGTIGPYSEENLAVAIAARDEEIRHERDREWILHQAVVSRKQQKWPDEGLPCCCRFGSDGDYITPGAQCGQHLEEERAARHAALTEAERVVRELCHRYCSLGKGEEQDRCEFCQAADAIRRLREEP